MAEHYPEYGQGILNGVGSHLNNDDDAWPVCDADGVPMLYGEHATITDAGISDEGDQADHLPFSDDFASDDGKWQLSLNGAAISGGKLGVYYHAGSDSYGSALRTAHHTDPWNVDGTPDVGTIWRAEIDFKTVIDSVYGEFASMPLGISLIRYGFPTSGNFNTFPVYFNFESETYYAPLPPDPPAELPDHEARLWEPDASSGTDIAVSTLGTKLVDGTVYTQKLELEYTGESAGPVHDFDIRGYLDGTEVVSGSISWSGPFPTLAAWHGVFQLSNFGQPNQSTTFDDYDFDVV